MEAAMTVYRAKRKDLHMPMDEDHLTHEHGEIQQASEEMLRSASGDILDTPTFLEANAKLSRQIADEWVRVQAKNVDLWKIHADEVTQCAYELGIKAKENCIVPGFCAHQILPILHSETARRHLLHCFKIKEQGMTARMGLGMQNKIFESWYA